MDHLDTSAVGDAHARNQSAGALSGLLNRADSIDLAEMDGVALQDRIDVKYVMTTTQLYDALTAMGHRYRVLEIGGHRIHPYRTLYFDTPSFDLYMHHHAGRCNRYKVRSRTYMGTGKSFFEVKHKTNKDRTQKSRISTPDMVTAFDPRTQGFVDAHLPAETRELRPTLLNEFSRVTLVSKNTAERLTLDLNVRFGCSDENHVEGVGPFVQLPGMAVAEVKRDGRGCPSEFITQMRSMGVREMSFSKYCIGVSMVYAHVKRNRFKGKLHLVQKLMHTASHEAQLQAGSHLHG